MRLRFNSISSFVHGWEMMFSAVAIVISVAIFYAVTEKFIAMATELTNKASHVNRL
jgi:hypothetical protein